MENIVWFLYAFQKCLLIQILCACMHVCVCKYVCAKHLMAPAGAWEHESLCGHLRLSHSFIGPTLLPVRIHPCKPFVTFRMYMPYPADVTLLPHFLVFWDYKCVLSHMAVFALYTTTPDVCKGSRNSYLTLYLKKWRLSKGIELQPPTPWWPTDVG